MEQCILSNFREMQRVVDWRGFDRLTPVSQALTALVAYCVELAPVEMGIENAAERIVAAPIRAPIAVPCSPIALGDGWAVAAQDTLGASSYAPGFTNTPPRRIACGDPMPSHADAVLPLSGVNAFSCPIEILSPAAPGENVRTTGGDFAAGDVIVSAGARLRPDHIALFRLAGIDEVSLRIPRVAIVSCRRFGVRGSNCSLGRGTVHQGRRGMLLVRAGHDSIGQFGRSNIASECRLHHCDWHPWIGLSCDPNTSERGRSSRPRCRHTAGRDNGRWVPADWVCPKFRPGRFHTGANRKCARGVAFACPAMPAPADWSEWAGPWGGIAVDTENCLESGNERSRSFAPRFRGGHRSKVAAFGDR